jgi:hypothetical protein
MSTDQAGSDTIDTALVGIRATLEADGYLLEWSIEEQNQIGVRVLAGPDACADCLVPPELMKAIMNKALSQTPYTIGSISLPADS